MCVPGLACFTICRSRSVSRPPVSPVSTPYQHSNCPLFPFPRNKSVRTRKKGELSRQPFICFAICPVQIHSLLHPTDWPKVTRPWSSLSALLPQLCAARDKIVIFREAAGETEGLGSPDLDYWGKRRNE